MSENGLVEEGLVTPETEVTEEVVVSETTETGEASEEEVEAKEENPEVAKVKEATQKRINQITREKYQEKMEKEKLASRVAELEQAQEAKTQSETPAPKLEDYDTQEEYLNAVADYRYAKNKADDDFKAKQRAKEIEEKDTKQKAVSNFEKNAAESRVKYPDFDEVVFAKTIPYSDVSRHLVLTSEASGELSYYLGKHLDVAERLASMNPYDAAKEVGKLEIKLTNVNKKAISEAPDPIDPIKDGGDILKKDPSKMDIDEWMKWNQANELAKLKKRMESGIT